MDIKKVILLDAWTSSSNYDFNIFTCTLLILVKFNIILIIRIKNVYSGDIRRVVNKVYYYTSET